MKPNKNKSPEHFLFYLFFILDFSEEKNNEGQKCLQITWTLDFVIFFKTA